MLRSQGISIVDNAKITNLKGDYKIEEIHFRKLDETASDYNSVNYFIKPDVVIVENGVGATRQDLQQMIGYEEAGVLSSLTFGNTGIPISNIRFSISSARPPAFRIRVSISPNSGVVKRNWLAVVCRCLNRSFSGGAKNLSE